MAVFHYFCVLGDAAILCYNMNSVASFSNKLAWFQHVRLVMIVTKQSIFVKHCVSLLLGMMKFVSQHEKMSKKQLLFERNQLPEHAVLAM